MRGFRPRVWIPVAIAAAFVVVSAFGLSSCISFGMKPERADAIFARTPYNRREAVYTVGDRTMHYAESGDPNKRSVVFVHGSPGSWDAFIGFMVDPELLRRARVVSVDRPGYGGSGRGIPERSLERQAADLVPVLESHREPEPPILVGHSYGGPVIARLAIDRPDLVGGLVFVAASIDPSLEKTKWYQIPADWLLLSWMVPKDLVTCNREILALKGELTLMMPSWSSIRAPSIVIQGGKDGLVPPANADFAERMLTAAPLKVVRVADMNHFVPWTRPDLIVSAIDELLDRDPAGR